MIDSVYDDFARPCSVWLQTTTIDNLEEEMKRLLNASANMEFCLKRLADMDALRHWSLVFIFKGNDQKHVYELAPVWHTTENYKIIQSKCTSYYEKKHARLFPLAITTTSPKKVFDKLMKHPQNGQQYDLLANNCQKWVIESLQLLEIDTKVPIPTGEQVAAVATVVAGGVWLLTQTVSHLSKKIAEKF